MGVELHLVSYSSRPLHQIEKIATLFQILITRGETDCGPVINPFEAQTHFFRANSYLRGEFTKISSYLY